MATSTNPVHTDPVRTAVRFPLHLEIVISTEKREYAAVTEDVSANGVLFSAAELPEVGERVEFRLKMPATIMGGSEDVLLDCKGRIVRHTLTGGKMMAAAVIDEYSLKAEHP
ncbi:MAG: PilZ domain-containing protein [Acidobacteriota bacterium]